MMADFSEFSEYTSLMESMSSAFPEYMREFNQETAEDFYNASVDLATSHVYTGAYIRSLDYEIIEENGMPAFVLGHLTQENERLHIYWKVLETGAAPNPNLPRKILTAWGIAVTGSPTLGYNLGVANTEGRQGINPNPIMSHLFMFGGDLDQGPTGLTSRGIQILRDNFNNFNNSTTSHWNRGAKVTVRRIPKGQPGAGRFV